MMKKTLLLTCWSVLVLATFVASYSTIQLMLHRRPIAAGRPGYSASSADQQPGLVLDTHIGINTMIQSEDARTIIVTDFLKRHDSPLTPYDHFASFIVATADKYGVDYRLIPAIMMQESNLCKSIPEGSKNCLGFGIHEGGTLGFDSYEEGIDRATKELKANYIDEGLTTPELIMKKYTPSSNGSWANSVNQWIAEMEYNDKEKGRADKTDANLTLYPSL